MADERLAHDVDSPWRGEHFFRYEEVLKNIDDNDTVLDIACGEGYGTCKIAGCTTGSVFGGDISPEAVLQCQETWKRPNLEFRVMDGTKLEFNSGFFDKIVSFETIEHTTEYRAFLGELHRVLADHGTLFLSTPNIVINSPSGVVENPYHTQEFELNEFRELVSSFFDTVEIYGQKYSRYDDRAAPLGRAVETIFSQRLIRRTPLNVKNALSNLAMGSPFYPQETDFRLVSSESEILDCQTFFCICRK